MTNRLAIRITLMVVFSMYIVFKLVLFGQQKIIEWQYLPDFQKEANNYISQLEKSDYLKNDNFVQKMHEPESQEIWFTPFSRDGHMLAEGIFYDKELGISLNNSPYITHENEKDFLHIPTDMYTTINIDDILFFVYKKVIERYEVTYISPFTSFTNTGSPFFHSWILSILTFLFFGLLAFYFSRLVIKPIQEQNRSLAMYNKNLAHEVRTPLSVIRTNLDMLSMTGDQKFIVSSQEEIAHIEKIIDSLLFLIEKSAPVESLQSENLVENIEKIATKFPKIHTNIEKKVTKLERKVAPHLFDIFLENIYENCEKYASEKQLNIVIDEKSISFSNPITHNIPKKDLKKIAEIFYQIDTSRSSHGYGLGIPMMKKIVENFGWKMEIHSKQQKFIVKIFL